MMRPPARMPSASSRIVASAVMLLPLPLSPTSPKISPRPTLNETPSTSYTSSDLRR